VDDARAITEALEQQTATSEILRAISSSPTTCSRSLDAVAENAARVRRQRRGIRRSRAISQTGRTIRVTHRVTRENLRPISRDLTIGVAILDRRVVHVPDLLAETGADFALAKTFAARLGFRTTLAAPMLRKGEAIGAILIRRVEVQPFTEKQIELLQTFADQAVIAIENVRLFQELQSRTQELADSVEQLKALAEVSQTVNSTLDLEQVLATIVTHAVELSSADNGILYEFDEALGTLRGRARVMASRTVWWANLEGKPLKLGRERGRRAAATHAPVQVSDFATEETYSEGVERSSSGPACVLRWRYRLLSEGRIVGGLGAEAP
jgi:GAF domain-containing protein